MIPADLLTEAIWLSCSLPKRRDAWTDWARSVTGHVFAEPQTLAIHEAWERAVTALAVEARGAR